jgi:hypothetical protein
MGTLIAGCRECTVLLLDDRSGDGHDQQLQSIAHGVIMMEGVEREYGIPRSFDGPRTNVRSVVQDD